jgi:putative FmdB family regulatory protein
MPIYTYRCESCGVQFERHQSYNDAPLKICPECRKKSLKKVIAPVGVVFKGSGFYATDNRSASGSAPRKEKQEDSKSSETTKTDAETKPAAAVKSDTAE